ncbi:MAG: SIR2 family protein [Anaerolineae bacterium]|nr:SIR2 family protein [Anaerolineae bacterium]
MLALLLGAGFSKWAANLPVAGELFDFAVEIWGPRDARKLDIVRSCKGAWDTTHPGSLAEQFIADALSFAEREKKAVLWYLTRRLSEPFIWREWHAGRWRRHVLMIDENRRLQIDGVVRARDFLQRFFGPALMGIITTNYDLLVEYALSTKGFNYGVPGEVLTGRGAYPVSQWLNPVKLTGRIPLAKIHGSSSWDERGHYTDGRRGLTGGALIVAPTPDKSRPKQLEGAWRLAEHILEGASAVLVFGFGFNAYDEAVLSLLTDSGRRIQSVLLIDIAPQAERARDLWPHATVSSSKPPPAGDPDIHSWYQDISIASQ